MVGDAPAAKRQASRTERRGWRPRFDGDFPTLGWTVLDWTFAFLPSPLDEHQPFRYTDEQARRVLEIYRLDPLTGTRMYRRVHEEEAKGWGKGPFAGSIALAEFRGPVCFDGWDANGQPVGVPWGTHGRPSPWVQIAAVSEDQTYNTWRAVYGFLTDDDHRAARDLRIDEGRTRLYAIDEPSAFMERVTASAGSREGQPVTHTVCDEPQLWFPATGGHDLVRTILRNLTKTDGWAHFTGNAPIVGTDSVAELYGVPAPGALHYATRPAERPQPDWSEEMKRAALEHVYQGVPWVSLDRVMADMADPAQPWPDSLRFFFNTRTDQNENPWIASAMWDDCAGDFVLRPDRPTFACVTVSHDHRSAAVACAQRDGDQIDLRVRRFGTGVLTGEAVDVDEVERYIRGLHRRYPAPVLAVKRYQPKGREHLVRQAGPEVVYHGAFFEGSAQKLRREGIPFVDVPETAGRLAPAAESLKAAVLEGRLVHEGDRSVAEDIGRVRAVEAATGWTLEGATPTVRSAVFAVHRAITAPAPKPNVMRRGLPPSATRRELS